MKTNFEIFGRKVSVLAIAIALLVIGTASAAVFVNYGVMGSSSVGVTAPITVLDSEGTPIPIDGNGALNFDVSGIMYPEVASSNFTIVNAGDVPVNVTLQTRIFEDIEGAEEPVEVTNDYYYIGEVQINAFRVHYSVFDDTSGVEANTPWKVIVPPEGLTIDIEFSTSANVIGDYTLEVIIAPSTW